MKKTFILSAMAAASLLIGSCKKANASNDTTTIITDIDGNVYHTVTIGTQVWMVENLKVTKYNDGTTIPLVTGYAEWKKPKTPGYCWYQNDAATYKNTYGALYNWYTVNTKKLCLTGWHVPTDTEWDALETYLGGYSTANVKMKEIGTAHWKSPNTMATNSSGFTALPGGCRGPDGKFVGIKNTGFWWSSTEYITYLAWKRYLTSGVADSISYRNTGNASSGFSVRCVKD